MRDANGALAFGAETSARADVDALEPIVCGVQDRRKFRRCDTVLVTLAVKSAINSAIVRLTHPHRA
ncbi:hypothetical protein GCM10009760_55680 [Kitasatospora kazusensis]|uniref:Uncharacterized protein n=1 Tax=Kitasatospora kazusensis TaxID=407974 RepID=A0ABN3A7J1_9ACTN